jgi:glycosyltransferase involved in cell wall biosynthesis
MDSGTEDSLRTSHPLTVIMPAYNEEENIALAVEEVIVEVLNRVQGADLIVVNDGSRDQTATILEQLQAKEPRLTVVNKSNSGHGPSLIVGMNKAAGTYLFLVDSDRQIPLDCFPELWQAARDHDAVFGIRESRQDPKFRLMLSTFIRVVINTVFGVRAADVNTPCKVFKRKIWQEIYARLQNDGILAPSLLIPIYAKRHNYRTLEIKVPHRARSKGETTLRIMPLLRFCRKGFEQLIHFREKLL